MSKRHFSEISDADTDESNKVHNPAHQPDSQSNDHLSVSQTNSLPNIKHNHIEPQPADAAIYPLSTGVDAEVSLDHSINAHTTSTDQTACDHSSNPGKLSTSQHEPVEQSGNLDSDSGKESDETDGAELERQFDLDMDVTYGIAKLSDFTIHFVDATVARISAHCHRVVLASMSKYFEAIIMADDDEALSNCQITETCKKPGHRCFNWSGFQVQDEDILSSITNFSEFLESMYAAFDGSGRCQKKYDSRFPDESYLWRVQSFDRLRRTVTFECWDYHGRFEYKSRTDSPWDLPDWDWNAPEEVGYLWQCVDRELSGFMFCFASYFECESLMKMYEANAIAVVNMLTKEYSTGFDLFWVFLIWADTYNWSALRARCLQAVVKDKKCQSRSSWKRIVASVKHETLAEAFALAVQSRR